MIDCKPMRATISETSCRSMSTVRGECDGCERKVGAEKNKGIRTGLTARAVPLHLRNKYVPPKKGGLGELCFCRLPRKQNAERHAGSNPAPSASIKGVVAERPKAAVLKTVSPKGDGGSNPPRSAIQKGRAAGKVAPRRINRTAQMRYARKSRWPGYLRPIRNPGLVMVVQRRAAA